ALSVAVYAIGSVLLVSLVSLAGVFTLSLGRARLEKVIFLLVSFAVGAMLAGALLHLIPRAYDQLGNGPLTGGLVIAGVLGFFVLEKFLHWRHQHGDPEALEGATGGVHAPHGHHHARPEPFAAMNLVGDAAHNFIDGMIVAAAYLVSVPAGVVTTLAVMLHEIPQEIGDFGVLVYGGYSPRRALLYNFLSGLTAVLGAVIALVVGARVEGFADGLLPVTAGAFLYVAGSDLIPELNRRHSQSAAKSAWQLVMMVLGVGVMLLPGLVEGWLGVAH
ncbi:MAG: ZIP family metal transporter, partial [Rubricoccaceae bacterium]|nr:ZIP family metal transporter [Rubricoccaceae bacterium]